MAQLTHGVSGINGSIKGRGVNIRKLSPAQRAALAAAALGRPRDQRPHGRPGGRNLQSHDLANPQGDPARIDGRGLTVTGGSHDHLRRKLLGRDRA
jgi:hypothetical protein